MSVRSSVFTELTEDGDVEAGRPSTGLGQEPPGLLRIEDGDGNLLSEVGNIE